MCLEWGVASKNNGSKKTEKNDYPIKSEKEYKEAKKKNPCNKKTKYNHINKYK